MKIRGEKTFEHDVSKLRDKGLIKRLFNVITNLERAASILEIHNCRKIQGYDNYYRVRIGDFRLGIKLLTGDEAVLIRFLHRKEIYRYFPPQ